MPRILRETASIKEFWLEPDSRSVAPATLGTANVFGKAYEQIPYSEAAGLEIRITPTSNRGILIDFGREVSGYPRLTFGAGHCRKVGVQAVESLQHLLNPLVAEAAAIADPIIYYHHVRARENGQVELPHFGGFRLSLIHI